MLSSRWEDVNYGNLKVKYNLPDGIADHPWDVNYGNLKVKYNRTEIIRCCSKRFRVF